MASVPNELPAHKTVDHVFAAWNRNRSVAALHDRLRALARRQAGRRSRSTATIIDSQTVRSVCQGRGNRKLREKEDQRMQTFTLGKQAGAESLVQATAADRPEREAAKQLLDENLARYGWLRKLWGG